MVIVVVVPSASAGVPFPAVPSGWTCATVNIGRSEIGLPQARQITTCQHLVSGVNAALIVDDIHARGPVGPEQLTTFAHVVAGSGQIPAVK